MQKLNNLSISKKILSILVIALISFCCIGVFFWSSNTVIFNNLEKTNDVASYLSKVRSVGEDLVSSKTNLLQALSWKMGYVEDKLVEETIADGQKNIDSVRNMLIEEKSHLAEFGVDEELYNQLIELVDAYNDSFSKASEMVMIDAETAILMLNDTFEKFNASYESISQVIVRATAYNNEKIEGLKETLNTNFIQVLAVLVAFTLILFVLGTLIGRAISRPIQLLTSVMTNLAGGDLEVEIPHQSRYDEVGNMAQAIGVFKDNLIQTKALEAAQQEKQKAELARADNIATTVKNFEGTVTNIVASFSKASEAMQSAAESLGVSVGTSENTSSSVSNASGEAMTNVDYVSQTVQEMSSAIQEISQQISSTMTTITSAVDLASYTSSETEKLKTAAEEIGSIVELIQSISQQTNLLALNATIESARAGEAGKGFAVVAAEVKELAGQSANATKQIASTIEDVQKISFSVIESIAKIRTSIEEVSTNSTTVATAIEEQSAITVDISENMKSAAHSVGAISKSMGDVISAVAGVKEVANNVRETSNVVSSHTTDLNKEVSVFCEKINQN